MADVLILWSGGKDSFLTACRTAESGDRAILFSCNGGSLAAEENLEHGAARLQNRYGQDAAEFVGTYATSGILRGIDGYWRGTPWERLAADYPGVTGNQAQCLHCQTAMWIAAIAYAQAKSIRTVAAGYKSHDAFCTGIADYVDAIRDLAAPYGIEIRLPLWETPEWGDNKDFGRDAEMMDRGFCPKVLEPKCLVGRPSEKPQGTAEASLIRFFRDRLMPEAQPYIERLVPMFKAIRLDKESHKAIHYPTPMPDGGIY